MWILRVLTISISLRVGLCGRLGNKAAHGGVVARQDAKSDNPVDAPSTSCGDIVVAANQGYTISYASDIMHCLGSLPFDSAVATQFIDYFNTTIQFQSTLTYLRDPPQGYQQPPVDVIQTLSQIKQNVTENVYKNQYAFEADLQLLVQQIHDTHVQLYAGALSAFSFASPRGLVSASVDGKQPPQIYLVDDVIACQNELDHGRCIPEPVVQINGVDVAKFLRDFAELNSFGYLEPHADFNSLMDSPVRDIQGDLSALQDLTFYPGDVLNFKYKNGSSYETYWLGIYRGGSDTGPLTTPGDFYNYFVLGLLPDSYKSGVEWWPALPPDTTNGSAPLPSSDYGCRRNGSNWCDTTFGAFPDDPVTTQADLSVTGTGIVSGYILDDFSTGVLSIPSFFQIDADVGTFSNAVSTFFGNATLHNVTRIIIDLQQNSGGSVLLAFDVFKQIFSSIEPYAGSRMRSHELADILGSTYTNWWNSLERHPDGPNGSGANGVNYEIHAADEWVVTDRINAATGQNFTSWQEYYGPVSAHGDTFSLTQQYNLSSQVFDEAAFDGWVPSGYNSQSPDDTKTLQWMPEDIIILTDGLCSSACALFVELMVHQAGVRTIALGGQPIAGPMQAVGGTRGARSYDASSLDLNMEFVNDTIRDHEAASRLPPRDSGVWFDYIGFNLRDQVRDNVSIPQQFKYESSDCRLFYTLQNVYNMSQLWRDVAYAAWTDPSMCVTNSTGFSTGRNSTFHKEPPSVTAKVPLLESSLHNHDTTTNFTNSILDSGRKEKRQYDEFTKCHKNCPGGCFTMNLDCGDEEMHPLSICAPLCNRVNKPCSRKGNIESKCIPHKHNFEAQMEVSHKKSGDKSGGTLTSVLFKGYCHPEKGTVELGCPVQASRSSVSD